MCECDTIPAQNDGHRLDAVALCGAGDPGKEDDWKLLSEGGIGIDNARWGGVECITVGFFLSQLCLAGCSPH